MMNALPIDEANASITFHPSTMGNSQGSAACASIVLAAEELGNATSLIEFNLVSDKRFESCYFQSIKEAKNANDILKDIFEVNLINPTTKKIY